MAQQLPANVKILRLFGVEQQVVENALHAAADQDGVQAQTMHRGGETLVVLQAQTEDPQAVKAVFSRWKLRLKAVCGDALYGVGDVTLPEAAVQVLKQYKKLFVCADEATGLLLQQRLDAVPDAETVYDFGGESYAHEKLGGKIAAAGQARKLAEDPVRQAMARIRAAYKLSGADWAVAHVPTGTGEAWLLVGDKKGVWVRYLTATEKPALWLLDMLRRAALDAQQADGTRWLNYGESIEAAQAPDPASRSLRPAAEMRRLHEMERPEEEGDPISTRPKAAPAKHGLLALLIVLVVAALAVGLVWAYTGGDLASFWEKSGLRQFSSQNAQLLLLHSRSR